MQSLYHQKDFLPGPAFPTYKGRRVCWEMCQLTKSQASRQTDREREEGGREMANEQKKKEGKEYAQKRKRQTGTVRTKYALKHQYKN